MRVSVVLGLTFGDEGKGVTTQWLCMQALKYGRKPLVARFNGGAQAAHTVNYRGEEHICSTYGSGVLLGVPTFLTKDFYFDPICAYNEYLTISDKKPVLMAHPDCRVVTPYDVIAGVNNKKVIKDGSCGKGLFQTFERYNNASFESILSQKDSEHHLRAFLEHVRQYYHADSNIELEDLFVHSMQELPLTVTAAPKTDSKTEIIYEGAQGLLLDMDYGFYPHVTPSHTGLDNIPEEQLQGANVYLVTRTYTTRHGNGYEPRHELLWDLSDKHEINVNNKYQGAFKTGMLEYGLIHKAIDRHHLDVWQKRHHLHYHLMVTHGDLALRHGYFDYLFSSGQWGKVSIESIKDVKRAFIHEMGKTPLQIQSVKVNTSIHSNFK